MNGTARENKKKIHLKTKSFLTLFDKRCEQKSTKSVCQYNCVPIELTNRERES
jgi:hypothetical protein